ncbi:hypothetical protein ED208_00855 [Stagnimonas aquatica]|uniref:DUF1453 domain-containing protein n=1 Tax=Stagnimonas aquatica TaxID=2689987 RepID=A0A3N0VK39_9GAMM|nr:hypothetical protein [Stagnimonas aquatica]ROH93117.1 hypothetical protein ED208_00855 [Stagnimonas aquatica]
MTHLPVLAYAAPLLAFSAYRRVRRNIGRQPYRPLRLWIRSGVIALIFFALLRWPAFEPALALAMIAGTVAGVLLARLGVRLTRFETLPDGRFYTPNTALGVGLSLLFLARIGYRLLVLLPALQAANESGGGAALRSAMSGSRSALTMALLGLVLGYFFAYCLGLLRRGRQPDTLPAEPAAP